MPIAASQASAPRRQPSTASINATVATTGNTTAWSAKSVRKHIMSGVA
jgi:hypothetical protein